MSGVTRLPLHAAALCLPALLVAGCSGAPEEAEPATTVPAAWLDDAAEGWPGSAGHGSSAPVLSGDDCVLTDEVVARGATARTDLSGWGPYGDDASADDAYRYVCEFRGDDLSAQLQLIQAGSPTDAAATVDLFLDQRTTSDQENEASTVQVAGVDVHVNHRWYPGPGYGEATALFHDEDADALVQLEVSSLDEDAFEAYTAQQVADDLMEQLGRA